MKLPTLLAVDDSEDDALLLKMACRNAKSHFQLHWVEDGEVAVRFLTGVEEFSDRDSFPSPDLILLDLNMPRKNGFELLEWLPGSKNAAVPTVIFTSSKQESDIETAYSLGAHSYVVKPVQFTELVKIVRVLDAILCEHADPSARLSALPTFKPNPQASLFGGASAQHAAHCNPDAPNKGT